MSALDDVRYRVGLLVGACDVVADPDKRPVFEEDCHKAFENLKMLKSKIYNATTVSDYEKMIYVTTTSVADLTVGDNEDSFKTCLSSTIHKMLHVNTHDENRLFAIITELMNTCPTMYDAIIPGGFNAMLLMLLNPVENTKWSRKKTRTMVKLVHHLFNLEPHTNLSMVYTYDATNKDSQRVHDKKHMNRKDCLNNTHRFENFRETTVATLLELFKKKNSQTAVLVWDEFNSKLKEKIIDPTCKNTFGYQKLVSPDTLLSNADIKNIRYINHPRTRPRDLFNLVSSTWMYDDSILNLGATTTNNNKTMLMVQSFMMPPIDSISVSALTNNGTVGNKITKTCSENVSGHLSALRKVSIMNEPVNNPLTKMMIGCKIDDGEGSVIIKEDRTHRGNTFVRNPEFEDYNVARPLRVD